MREIFLKKGSTIVHIIDGRKGVTWHIYGLAKTASCGPQFKFDETVESLKKGGYKPISPDYKFNNTTVVFTDKGAKVIRRELTTKRPK